MRYKIIETECYPNKYKVVWLDYRDNNSLDKYHPTHEAAKAWAEKFKDQK